MEIRNLNQENVDALKKTFNEKVAPNNSEATMRVFQMQPEGGAENPAPLIIRALTDRERIDQIAEQLLNLTNKFNHIFDGHVLINGEFKKIT